MRDRNQGIAVGLAFVAIGIGADFIDLVILRSDFSYVIGIPWVPFAGTALIVAGLGFLYVNISRKFD